MSSMGWNTLAMMVYLTESALLRSIFRQIATTDGSGNLQEPQLTLMLLRPFADQYSKHIPSA
jgi:hypothetical protein